MGAAAPKPPLAIPPHSKLCGFLAFSHEEGLSHQLGFIMWKVEHQCL